MTRPRRAAPGPASAAPARPSIGEVELSPLGEAPLPDPGAALEAAVRRLFRPDTTEERLGIEVEVTPMRADGTRVSPDELSRALTALAASEGWREEVSPAGAPAWALPGGGALSWEPGGQLEYSSGAVADFPAAVEAARRVMRRAATAARSQGILLLARGMDPATPVERTELLLGHPRYTRMTRHYARRGPEGERMMRLTAGIHVNVDLGPDPLLRWRAANRLVPAWIAAFANSPVRHGAGERWRSHRSEQWRALDPSRTGCFPAEDPIREYLEFAREADAFLLGEESSAARPWRDHRETATAPDLDAHLTTLFPEVRPRGYLELRCFDALPACDYDLPVAAVTGLLLDPGTAEWAAAALPAPTESRLRLAGRSGVRAPEVHAEVMAVLERACEGLARLGRRHGAHRLLPRLQAFRNDVTCRGLDPGDAPTHWVDDEPEGGSGR